MTGLQELLVTSEPFSSQFGSWTLPPHPDDYFPLSAAFQLGPKPPPPPPDDLLVLGPRPPRPHTPPTPPPVPDDSFSDRLTHPFHDLPSRYPTPPPDDSIMPAKEENGAS